MAIVLRFISLTLLAALLVVPAGMTVAAAEDVIELDFTKIVTNGGEWEVDLSGESPVVTQHLPMGGIAWLVLEGIQLPDNFAFEAELGVISGNHAEHRPYFGLLFNNQYQEPLKQIYPGYRFTFRPSSQRWELEKRTPGSEILTYHTDVMPWPWQLAEWRTLKVVRQGDKIETYVNGELIMSYTDADHKGGTVGLWTYSTAAVFRNIRLTVQ